MSTLTKLLFVDDEENILSSLVRLFRKDNYDIYTAACGREGIRILEDNDVSLIISDHRMPEMTGVEFLARAKEIAPKAIRIMLTGYADTESAIAAINKGEVYRFISKPWNDDELKLTVKQSLEYRELVLKNRSLLQKVKKQQDILMELEKTNPGITSIHKSEDGAIIIDENADLDIPTDIIL